MDKSNLSTPQSKSRDRFYGNGYRKARRRAFARSEGVCQACGLHAAEEAHHWAAGSYPTDDEVGKNDLVALCRACHEIVTTVRRQLVQASSIPVEHPVKHLAFIDHRPGVVHSLAQLRGFGCRQARGIGRWARSDEAGEKSEEAVDHRPASCRRNALGCGRCG